MLLNPKKILAFSLSFAVTLSLFGNGCNGVKYKAQNAENTVQINTYEASSDNSYGVYRDLYKDKNSTVSEYIRLSTFQVAVFITPVMGNP